MGGIVAGGTGEALEVGGPHLGPMAGEVMGLLGVRRLFVNPFMGPHIAHTVEVAPIFYGNTRCSNIADQHAMLQYLYFCGGGDCSVDLPAGHQRSSGDNAFDYRLFSDDQSAGGMDFPLDAAIDTYRSIKVDDPFKIHPFSEEREIFTITVVLSLFFA